jgi:hypothetical protein
MISYSISSTLFWTGVFILIVGVWLSWRIGKKGTNMVVFISFSVFAYLTGEGVTYLISPSKGVSGFNQACTKFDPVRGYRWLGNDIRNFKISQDEVVYDNHFYPNNMGWVMNQDYNYEKKDSLKKRWMILGDSFIAGIMLETNLPNRAQQILNDSLGEGEIELYSFGVDGGGIMNWYNIFFKEIIAKYEFDGLIIAPYADNLYRDFMIMLIQKKGFIGRVDSIHWSDESTILEEDFNALKEYDHIYTDAEIDQIIKNTPKEFEWLFKKNVLRLANSFKNSNKEKETKQVSTIEQLNRKMGAKKSRYLDEIISWCQSNQKQIILASIPSKNEIKNELIGEKNQHKIEMEILAEEYQLNYFDGYHVFTDLDDKEINAHWLKYDGHWNQQGSDRYAKYFVNYLQPVN